MVTLFSKPCYFLLYASLSGSPLYLTESQAKLLTLNKNFITERCTAPFQLVMFAEEQSIPVGNNVTEQLL